MKIVYEYSHLGGSEIMQVRYPEINREVNEVIASVKAERIKESQEKNKIGRMLYSPVEYREAFNQRGFKELRDTCSITLPNSDVEIKNAFKQIDFTKEKVNIEVQFGKYAFMFYDMAKFQYFLNENKADVGIEIVPCHGLHHQMSSGVSYGEQLIYDIERLKRHFPSVPVKVILVDVD